MITDNYGRNCNTDTRKTEELFAIFTTNSACYVSGWKLARAWNIKGAILGDRRDEVGAELAHHSVFEAFSLVQNDDIKEEVATSLVEIGYLKLYKNEESAAIAAFDEVVDRYHRSRGQRLKAQVADAQLGKASCLTSMQLLAESLKIYDLVAKRYLRSNFLMLKLKSYEALLQKSFSLRKFGDTEMALTTCEALISETTDSTDYQCVYYFIRASLLKGSIYEKIDSYYEAIECYDLILKKSNDEAKKRSGIEVARAYLRKSSALSHLQNHKLATEILDTFISEFISLNDRKLNYFIVQAYVKKADYCRRYDYNKSVGFYDEAIRFVRSADIETDNNYWIKKAFERKARVLEKQGMVDETRDLYIELLKLYPHDVDVKLTLARLTSKTDLVSSSLQIREIVEKVVQKIGDKKKFFESHMKETSDRFSDFLFMGSKLSNEAFILTLRRWNSFTPIIPVDGETSRGGGYFIRAYDRNEDKWRGIVIDPGYNFIENFCNAGGRVHDIDVVVITHAHNDHTIDFESLCTLFHKYNKENKVCRKVKFYFNIGTFMKFSGLLDLRNAKYIDDIVVLNTYDKHTIFPGLDLHVQPAYHDEIITKNHAVGLLFSFSESTKGRDKNAGIDGNNRYVLFTGDTSLYPSKSVDGELEADVLEGNEIHKMYRPDLISAKGDIALDLLVAHIGSIYKDELDPEASYSKRFYPNHLGIMGVVSLINDLRPRITLISEFGEELMSIRLKLVEGIASIFDGGFHPDEDNEQTHEKRNNPVILPCDLSLIYKIFDRTIYCVNTHKDEAYNRIECFSEDRNLYYKTKGTEDFDRAAAVRQYRYGLNGPNQITSPRTPSHLKS